MRETAQDVIIAVSQPHGMRPTGQHAVTGKRCRKERGENAKEQRTMLLKLRQNLKRRNF